MLGSRLDEHLRRHGRWAVGLMSGTSLDGVDAALVDMREPEPRAWRLHGFETTAFRHAPVARLRAVAQGEPTRAAELSELSMRLARDHEAAVRAVCATASIEPSELAFVAAHGVTVAHEPHAQPSHTSQLLAGAALAAWLRTIVVDGFRVADVALGGEGAPLAPVADLALRTSDEEDRAVLNLGGIANVTLLGAGVRSLSDVVAGDVGPANLPLDILRRHQTRGAEDYDAGGRTALAGAAEPALVREMLDEAWVRRSLPRSFGREQFGTPFVDGFLVRAAHLSAEDQMATLVALEASAVRGFLDEVAGRWRRLDDRPLGLYVTGGGRHNRAMLQALARELPSARIDGIEALGISADAKEAFDFAFLGWTCLCGQDAHASAVTGAQRDAILGSIHAPAVSA